MYGLHTEDINHIQCLLHLCREWMNVFFGPFFPAVRQGKGRPLIPFAQVKWALCVHRGEGGNTLPALPMHQRPGLGKDGRLACGDWLRSPRPRGEGGVRARLIQSCLWSFSTSSSCWEETWKSGGKPQRGLGSTFWVGNYLISSCIRKWVILHSTS